MNSSLPPWERWRGQHYLPYTSASSPQQHYPELYARVKMLSPCTGQNHHHTPVTQTPEHPKHSFYGWSTAFCYYDYFLRIPCMTAESTSLPLPALALQLRPLPLKLRTSSPWPPLYTHTQTHTHTRLSPLSAAHMYMCLGVTSWEWIHAYCHYYLGVLLFLVYCFYFFYNSLM